MFSHRGWDKGAWSLLSIFICMNVYPNKELRKSVRVPMRKIKGTHSWGLTESFYITLYFSIAQCYQYLQSLLLGLKNALCVLTW